MECSAPAAPAVPALLLILFSARIANCQDSQHYLESEAGKIDEKLSDMSLDGAKCDQLFVSRTGGEMTGSFESPAVYNPMGYTRKCLLKFIAPPNFRVKISFKISQLRGTYPDCNHEYMDIFSELRRPDEDLLLSPFGGRYCGRIAPRPRISLYNALVLAFSTDQNFTDTSIFYGSYQFVNASRYALGEPISNSPCSFIINTNLKRKGTLMSPTYPGVYPKGLNCEYRFIGEPGQRIRVEFRDFDLFMGGYHCPFDFLRIYDGANKSAPLIGTFCQPERNLVKYSTTEFLLITFVTIQRKPNPEKRGFYGIFEFSQNFVNLGFITGNHIRGTECDQRILSKKESSGKVFSPNYPYPYLENIVCKYFIYGMKDSQHLERVQLNFERFDVPDSGSSTDVDTLKSMSSSSTDLLSMNTQECEDGYLRIYLRGQEVKDAYDKYDHQFCGRQLPESVRSNGPRFAMVFSSGEAQGSGFKADYRFQTEYLIPGTAAPDGSCRFSYTSAAHKYGEFNSPRHPANYPSGTTCQYTFETTRNEQVRIVFDAFKVRADNVNGSSYGRQNCHEDWLEIHNLYYDNSSDLIGRYCDMSTPGPAESLRGSRGIRVILHTDAIHVYSGFKARYIYHKAKDIFGDCGQNVSGKIDGVVASPNFPANYPARGSKACNWFIHTKPGHRIMLFFDTFVVEGDRNSRGCPAAVVRVWQDLKAPPLELCGDGLSDDHKQLISLKNVMKVSFISAEKSVGNKGFRAYWTQIGEVDECEEFQCETNKYCLSSSLRCNSRKNCGAGDESDEENCATAAEVDVLMLLVVLAALVGVLLLVVCLWCRASRRGRLARAGLAGSLSPAGRHVHACDPLGSRLSTMDTV